jgi:uncharacterized membrane protein
MNESSMRELLRAADPARDLQPVHQSTVDDALRSLRTAAVVAPRPRTRRLQVAWAVVAVFAVVSLAIVAPVGFNAARHQGDPGPATSGSAPPPRRLPTSCPVERLPVPARSVTDMVTGMDSTGRYIVGRSYRVGSGDSLDMLLWDRGVLEVVALPGTEQLPTAINSSGVAVGDSGYPYGPAWVYRGGAATYLQGDQPTHAGGINNAGVIVGSEALTRPVVWRSASSLLQPLPMPLGVWEGSADAIDSDGTIVGTLRRQHFGPGQAYVWRPDGSLRALPLPVINGVEAVGSSAQSIAGNWVAGSATGPGGGGVAARWNLRTGDVQTFPGLRFGGDAVSADGWLVGNNDHGQAVLATYPDTLALPDLNNHNNSVANIAVAISSDGHLIAGNGSAGGALSEPVIWRCD